MLYRFFFIFLTALTSCNSWKAGSYEAEPSATQGIQKEPLNVEGLMDNLEQQYPQLFPLHESTRAHNGWVYRQYPQTGTYLAVINSRVFLFGGPFGPEARDQGAISDPISIALPPNLPPPSAPSECPVILRTMTVARLDRCPNELGSSKHYTYDCLIGTTPVGTLTLDENKSCSLTVSDAGLVTVLADGQTYSLEVPKLNATERSFTRTEQLLNFDYGTTTPGTNALRIRGRTIDKVAGQFFQQGGELLVYVYRAEPAVELICKIPLALF